MAKKKRKRPVVAGSQGRVTTVIRAESTRQQLPRVAPAEPGGPNRLARKEEARRQREAIRRKMARRRTYRIVGAILVVVLVAAGITVFTLTRPEPVAACGSIKTIRPFSSARDRAHVAPGSREPLSDYPSHPPTSGPHDGTPLPSGIYDNPPDVYRAIHSLEHGAVIVWYRPGLNSRELQRIKDFFGQPPNRDHVLVAPYSYPGQGESGQLPAGSDMVLVAWHHMESCGSASLASVQSFVADYRTPFGVPRPAGYKGDAPEAGVAIDPA